MRRSEESIEDLQEFIHPMILFVMTTGKICASDLEPLKAVLARMRSENLF
jgi:hypothetical protein